MSITQQNFQSINPNISQQRLIGLKFNLLKSFRNFDMNFSGNNLTAILGVNGCGKSTIIHTLACCYQPINVNESINYKFSHFFLPTTHSIWQGSEFILTHSYRTSDRVNEVETRYDKQTNRWKPIYKRRPARYVSFIGIKTCVPKIEEESKQSLIQYSTQSLSDELSLRVKEHASCIMNRNYTEYNIHLATGKEYIRVKYEGQGYSSLSMGAGEQRVFYILTEVFKAPKYSLILIDEIDLLLHDDALTKLLKVLIDRADDKNLQIIFTTHAQLIIDFSEQINIRHIFQTRERTLCFNETKPDAIHRLTGKQERPLEIFVEDDLARAVVKKACGELGLSKYVSIKEYGAAQNCFAVLSGVLLNEDENIDNMLFVLDGDVYKSPQEKIDQIAKILTGNTPKFRQIRENAVKYVRQFVIYGNLKPEQFLHNLIVELSAPTSEENNEIINVAKNINVVDNSHKYIDDIIKRMDFDRSAGLKVITDLVALSPKWQDFIIEIKDWLTSKKDQIAE